MKFNKRASLSSLLGDYIAYRNLIPIDANLPGLPQLRHQLGIEPGNAPRKTTLDYARVLHAMLQAASKIHSSIPLARLIYVGDTRLNDGTAFKNLSIISDWPGMAFIGSENDRSPGLIPEKMGSNMLYKANRWSGIEPFSHLLMEQGFVVDEASVVLIDMDKTALGARGRNDRVIDQARLEAARSIASDVLGEGYDLPIFQENYETLNQPEFHLLTADNQDYLVYICLLLSGGWINLNQLLAWYSDKEVVSFDQLVVKSEAAKSGFAQGIRKMHELFYDSYAQRDPTPFKAFRYCEYLATVSRMGHLPDDSLPEILLNEEIVLTGEVYDIAQQWQSQGALLFGISDKPDEASMPSPEQAVAGLRAIHQTETHVLGV